MTGTLAQAQAALARLAEAVTPRRARLYVDRGDGICAVADIGRAGTRSLASS